MKFCSSCSAPVIVQIPEGDRLPRHVCIECGTIHYQNPRIVGITAAGPASGFQSGAFWRRLAMRP